MHDAVASGWHVAASNPDTLASFGSTATPVQHTEPGAQSAVSSHAMLGAPHWAVLVAQWSAAPPGAIDE